jgi:tight adherence protein B
MNLLIIGVILLVVIIVLIIAAASLRSERGEVLEERLEQFTENQQWLAVQREQEEKAAQEAKGKKQESALTKRLNQALEGRQFASKWRTQLTRADLKITVGEFFAVHIISVIGLSFFTYFFLTNQQIVQTMIAGGIGFFLPRLYVGNRVSQRFHQFESQLPDILSLWVNSLRSGYSVPQALEAISREAPDPSAGELKRVVREMQLGIPMEKALDHLLERMPSEDLDLIVTAVNIQREVGGNLAEILEVIGHTIRERIKLKGEIRVLTAQGRITGYIIGGLPIALGLFLYLVNPDYMGGMFQHRGCGWPMIGIGLGLIGLGTAVIQRIVDIEI